MEWVVEICLHSLQSVWPQTPLRSLSSDHLSYALCARCILDACSGQADGGATRSRENRVSGPPAAALRHREA